MSNSIIKNLSVKTGLSEDHLEIIINDFWKGVRTEITNNKGKDILLKGFGKFMYKENILKYNLCRYHKMLESNEKNFQNSKSNITTEKWFNYIRKWQHITRHINKLNNMLVTKERRKTRQKGERGL